MQVLRLPVPVPVPVPVLVLVLEKLVLEKLVLEKLVQFLQLLELVVAAQLLQPLSHLQQMKRLLLVVAVATQSRC
jgi:hypothetical protein